jgi:hypothetical protein
MWVFSLIIAIAVTILYGPAIHRWYDHIFGANAAMAELITMAAAILLFLFARGRSDGGSN